MVLSYAMPAFLYIVQYYAFHINSNAVSCSIVCHYSFIIRRISELIRLQVKRMWKNIRDSWNLLKNDAERDIMRQFSSSGELHTKLIACT